MNGSKKKLSRKQDFKATSKPIQYIDYSLGYPFKTRISYEFGLYKGKKAVCFFIDGNFESLRIIHRKNPKEQFKIYKFGGQTLHSSRRQREKCLELTTRALFEKYGFKVKLKPKLGPYHPDMLIKKDKLTIYVELKAYHESYLCGDSEIAQVMKYFREIKNLNSHSKIILITSGSLIDSQNSFLQNQKNDPIQYVNSYYKKLIIPRSQIKSIEDFSARDIYKQAAKKFKKNYGNGFPPMKVVFFNKNHIPNFPSCLFSKEKYDVLLLDSDDFYD
ncbi:MAG: hypothetical protein ACFE75_06985, partial [Candidatus Hodarchaeota archaeon]